MGAAQDLNSKDVYCLEGYGREGCADGPFGRRRRREGTVGMGSCRNIVLLSGVQGKLSTLT